MTTVPIFYSYRIGEALLADTPPLLDPQNPYHQCLQTVQAGCEKAGLSLVELPRPEMYHHDVAFSHLQGFQPQVTHLIIKPLSNIALLRRAYNILVLVSPQIDFAGEGLILHPMAMERRLLSKVDEIWTLYAQSSQALNALNMAHARHVPVETIPAALATLQARHPIEHVE